MEGVETTLTLTFGVYYYLMRTLRGFEEVYGEDAEWMPTFDWELSSQTIGKAVVEHVEGNFSVRPPDLMEDG